jgi:hypothetical protein
MQAMQGENDGMKKVATMPPNMLPTISHGIRNFMD